MSDQGAPASDAPTTAVVRYSDREIAKILKRATELQRAAPSLPDPLGITLDELEEIAREAGIDVAHLRQAAREVRRGPDNTDLETRLLGAPLVARYEHEVEGELPVEAFDALVPILQAGTDGTGQASRVGRALTWTSGAGNNSRRLQVLIHAQDGKTLVRVEERSEETAAALHIGFGAGGLAPGLPIGMNAAAALGVVGGIAVGAAITAACWAIGRALYGISTRKRAGALEALFRDIIATVESRVTRGAIEPSPTPALASSAEEQTT